jgi:hypothetical protein
MISNIFSHIAVGELNTMSVPRVNNIYYPPPDIPDYLNTQFPRLNNILTKIPKPMNNIYWSTMPPSKDVMNWGWTGFNLWSEQGQKKFDQIWPAGGDDWIDSLIDIYGSTWHQVLPSLAARDLPEFISNLSSLCDNGEIVVSGKYADKPNRALYHYLFLAPWVRTVKRRNWPFPFPKYCSVCGIGFYADTVGFIGIWGIGLCPRCQYLATYGVSETSPLSRNISLNSAIKSLTILASISQTIPPESFRENFVNPGFDSTTQAKLIAAMICVPNASVIKKKAGGVSWLEILQKAGLVGEAWRPGYGTFCIAKDGHKCRSLAEQSIDDWLTMRGINHKIEPYWPEDSDLNPSGKLRADWELYDGTFVEYAGLSSDDYISRIEKKRKLALKNNLKLIVLFPDDLQRLGEIFHPWENTFMKPTVQ